MVEDALEVGRVLPGDLLLHLTSSLFLPALEVPLQDDQSLCVSALRKILYWSHLLKDLTKRGNQTSLACFPNLSGNIEQGSLIENTHHLNTFRMKILKKTCQRQGVRFPFCSLRLEGMRLDILWENQDLIKTLPRSYLLKQKNVIQSRLCTQNEFLPGWQNMAAFSWAQKWQWKFSSSAYLQF